MDGTAPGDGLDATGQRRLRRFFIAAVCVAAIVVPFFELGDFRTFGSHEAYATVPARTMMETGNWIVPLFGGVPRLTKPPLVYWTVAGSATLFGELNEWTARVPAAIAAVLLTLLVGWQAGRWYGPVAGIAAAAVQITSVYMIIFSRKAEVDMLLVLLTTAAMFLIIGQSPEESRRRTFARWAGIHALLAIAWMGKFHYGPAMVLAPVVVFFVVERRFRDFFSPLMFGNPLGLCFSAAAVLVWPMLLLQQVPDAWEIWHRETLGRAVGSLGHQPFWFYGPHLLWMTLPWTPLVAFALPGSWQRAFPRGGTVRTSRFSRWCDRIAGIFRDGTSAETSADLSPATADTSPVSGTPKLWKTRLHAFFHWATTLHTRGDARERFLWIWFLVQLTIVTVSANKHKHYLLAALPVCSLWSAQVLLRIVHHLQRGNRLLLPWQSAVIAASYVIGPVIGVGVLMGKWPFLWAPSLVAGVSLTCGGLLATWLFHRRRPTAGALALIVMLAGLYLPVVGWLLPGRDHRQIAVDFARQAMEHRDETPVWVYLMGEDPIVYYLGSDAVRTDSRELLQRQLATGQRMKVITFEAVAKKFRDIATVRVLGRDQEIPSNVRSKLPPLALLELNATPEFIAAYHNTEPTRLADAAAKPIEDRTTARPVIQQAGYDQQLNSDDDESGRSTEPIRSAEAPQPPRTFR